MDRFYILWIYGTTSTGRYWVSFFSLVSVMLHDLRVLNYGFVIFQFSLFILIFNLRFDWFHKYEWNCNWKILLIEIVCKINYITPQDREDTNHKSLYTYSYNNEFYYY